MTQKRISGRQLRHGSPEESLSPGESLTISKRGGKVFQLTRTDSGRRDINAQMDQLFKDIPPQGPRSKTDLVRVLLEERE
jgi:antitoxin (DNA-binding transcriptional repressor) of toxin-antitoxin stability system